MRRIVLGMTCGVAVAAGGLYVATRLAGDPIAAPKVDAAPAAALREKTALLEKELAEEEKARARGLARDLDVDTARVNLAKARHDAALVAGDRAEALAQLRVILAVRKREWEREAAAIDRGLISQAEADDLRRRLAVAHFRLAAAEGREEEARKQLLQVTEACDRQVQRLGRGYAQRAVTLRDVNAARYRAGCARYVIARAGGRSEEIRAEIDRAVKLWEAEASRVRQLHQTGAASYFESYEARWYHLDACLRRATFDRDQKAAAEQLQLQIALAEEALPRLDPADPFLKRSRPSIEWHLVFNRQSLERLQRDNVFPPDTAAAELDR